MPSPPCTCRGCPHGCAMQGTEQAVAGCSKASGRSVQGTHPSLAASVCDGDLTYQMTSLPLSTLLPSLLIGLLWGLTNPLVKRGSAVADRKQAAAAAKRGKALLTDSWVALLTTPQFLIPQLINQCGSALFIYLLGQVDISRVVPSANASRYTHSHAHMHTHMHTNTCMHAHAHTHACMHTNTAYTQHTQRCMRRRYPHTTRL